jgi:hypothetical protein
MRKILKFSALFVLMAAGAYAQNVSLREGYYQTQGFADHIFIAPNRADAGQGNTPENAFKTQRGSYGVMTWAGMPEPSNLFYTATGNVVGDEFRINIERRHRNIAAHGLNIPRGTLAIWRIVNNETFIDESGQRWIWRRQR